MRYRRALTPVILGFSLFFACKKIERPGLDAGMADVGSIRDAAPDARDAGHEAGVDAGEAIVVVDAGPQPVPPRHSEELTLRMRHLAEAVASDNMDLGRDALYPRDAFVAFYDSKDNGRYWDKRVATAFRKELARLHRRTKNVANAKFVSFDVGQVTENANKKDWRIPVHMAHHAKLTLSIDGKVVTLTVAELVAHHGHWYVLRL
jgi:hypothetical protein